MDVRIETGLFENGFPEVVGFLVEVGWFALAGFVDGGLQSLLGELPYFGDEFPCPFDRLLLKVVAE